MNRIVALLAVVSTLLVMPVSSHAAGKPSASTPTATLFDTGNDAVPYRIASDGAGTYAFSWLGSGDLSIDSGYGKRRPTRAHSISFTEAATGAWQGADPQAAPPFIERDVPAQLIVACGSKRGLDMQTIQTGSSVLCPMLVYFDWGGVGYRVGINSASEHLADGWPQGEDARVTCTAGVVSGGVNNCSAWRIEPSGLPTTVYYGNTLDMNPKSRGMLFVGSTNELLGYYYFSFRIEARE